MYALYRARNGSREFCDFDYLDDLSDEDLEWLHAFCREYYRADFPKQFDHVHPDSQRKDCYNRSNAARRDMWARFQRLMGEPADDDQDRGAE